MVLGDMERKMKMIRALLGIGLLIGALASASPSGAADVPNYKNSPRGSVFNWDGFYVGGSANYAFGDIDYSGLGGAITVEPRGYGVGGIVGYNMHFTSNLIVGVEGDLNWMNIDRTTGIVPGVGLNGGIDYYSTVRARLGYSFGSWMFHLNGGWAGAHLASNVTGVGLSAEDFISGWAYGAGVDFAITNNLWLGLEYQRLDFSGSQNFGLATLNADAQIDIVKAALRYRFGR